MVVQLKVPVQLYMRMQISEPTLNKYHTWRNYYPVDFYSDSNKV